MSIFGYPNNLTGGSSGARVWLRYPDSDLPNGYMIIEGDGITLTYNDVNNTVTIASSGGGGDSTSTYVTVNDETGTLTNSRYIVAGNNVTVDTSISGQLIINAAATGGGAPTTASYVTVTTEPSLSAERYLAEAYGVTITDNTSNVSIGLSSTFLAIPFLCLSNPSGLNGERLFQVSGGLSSSDLGAGSTFTVSGSSFQQPEYIVAQADATIPNAKVLQAGTGLNLDTTSNAILTNTASSFGQVVVAGQDTIYAFRLQDAIEFAQGSEITLTVSGSTLTIATTAEQNQNTFSVVAASGWPNLSSSSVTDTLNILAQDGLYAGTIPGSNTLVLSGSGISGGNSFGIITVSGQSDVTASTATDTVEFIGAGAIDITTSGNQITFTASVTGGSGAPTDAQYLVLSTDSTLSDERVLVASTGLSLSDGGAGNNATLTNTASSFGKIEVEGQSDVVAQFLQDQFKLAAGSNITFSVSGSTITINSTASGGGGGGNAFETFSVSGQNDIVADSTADTFTFVNGQGITLTTNDTTDSLTVTNSASGFSRIAIQGQSDVLAYLLQDQFGFVAGDNVILTVAGSNITIAVPGASGEVNQNAFSNFAVSGQNTVIADSTQDTVTFVEGSRGGLGITTNDTTDSITFTNTSSGYAQILVSGQSTLNAMQLQDSLNLIAGNGISITTALPSSITFTNSSPNVDQNLFSTIQPIGFAAITAGSTTDTLSVQGSDGITVGNTSDILTVSGSGLQPIDANLTRLSGQSAPSGGQLLIGTSAGGYDVAAPIAGWGIGVSLGDGSITINSLASGEANQNAFSNIAVSGQNTIVADSTQDTLTVATGQGISATTNDTTDTLTLTNTASGFSRIKVSGQNDVVAYLQQDQFGLVASTNMTITTSGSSVTFAAAGGGGLSYSTVSSSASAQVSYAHGVNTSGGNVTLYLPTGMSSGAELYIKHKTAGNTLTIQPYSGTIDGETSITSSLEKDAWHLIWDGTSDWEIY